MNKIVLSLPLLISAFIITSSYARAPMQFAQHLVSEDSLDLSDSKLEDKDIPAILSYLNKHPEIKSLNLKDNLISSAGAIELAKNTTLTELDLSHRQSCKDWGPTACIGDEGAKAFAQNNTLKSLNLSLDRVSNEGATALAKNS